MADVATPPILLVDGRVFAPGGRPQRARGGNPGAQTPRQEWRVAGGIFGMDDCEDAPPGTECRHKSWHRYTRAPCSCNRTLWPRRGQGRGESPTSPRRLAAKARAVQALELRRAGMPWADIARRLKYASKSGAHAAVLRLLMDDARQAGDRQWRSAAYGHPRHVLVLLTLNKPGAFDRTWDRLTRLPKKRG